MTSILVCCKFNYGLKLMGLVVLDGLVTKKKGGDWMMWKGGGVVWFVGVGWLVYR